VEDEINITYVHCYMQSLRCYPMETLLGLDTQWSRGKLKEKRDEMGKLKNFRLRHLNNEGQEWKQVTLRGG
jgi:hypothetical protein